MIYKYLWPFISPQDLPDTNSLVTSLYLEVSKQEAREMTMRGESQGNPLWVCSTWPPAFSKFVNHFMWPLCVHLILAGLQQWFLRAGCLPAAPASAEGHAHAAVAGRRTSSQCTHKKLKYNRSPIEKIYILYLSAHFCINCYVILLCITVMPSLQYSNFKNSLSIPAVFMLVKVYSGGQANSQCKWRRCGVWIFVNQGEYFCVYTEFR